MTRHLAAALWLGTVVASPAAAQLNIPRIDSLVEARRSDHGIPGIALAIVHPLDVLHERGFGTSRDQATVLSGATPFAIPAYSGPITGTLAFRLVDRGDLGLDDPVASYLPNFVLADTTASDRVTPRQLLLHRSGVSASPTSTGAPPPSPLAEVVTGLRQAGPTAAAGDSFTYSETNYQILAHLLEVVSGTAYPDLVHSEIRNPLGLAAPASPDAPGTLTFSAHELGRFVRAHLNLGAIGDTTLLTITSVVEMTSFDSGARFAAGWGWRTMEGRNAIGYSGVLEASQLEIVMLPSDGIGVVVLANGTNASQRRGMQRLAEDVARMAVGAEPLPAPRSPRGTLVLALTAAVAVAAAVRVVQLRRQAA